MRRGAGERLEEIRLAAEGGVAFCGGLDEAAFAALPTSDRRTFRALKKVLAEIGEAVKLLPPELLARHPEVDWRGWAGLRDEPNTTAVLIRNGAVQREREALRHYLQGAYRDPAAAQATLGELVKQRGWYQVREEIAGDPTQFDELRGKMGWFVSAASKEEQGTIYIAASTCCLQIARFDRRMRA